MCAPKMPSPPDPWETATAQGALNNTSAFAQNRLNQVNQTTPYGSLTYQPTGEDITYNQFNQQLYDDRLALRQRSGIGGVPDASSPFFNNTVTVGPEYEAIVSLSPEGQKLHDGQTQLQQGLLDTGNAQLGRVSDALGRPLNFDDMPAFGQAPTGIGSGGTVMGSIGNPGTVVGSVGNPGAVMGSIERPGPIRSTVGADDFGDDRMRVEQALMDRMQPYIDQRREQERNRLIGQGFADPESEGYSVRMDEVNRAENDARLAAIGAAGGEQQRLFDMDVAKTGFANAAQQQAFGQRMSQAALNNSAVAQRFGQNAAATQINNQAVAQRYGQEMGEAQLNNQAVAQRFGQNATRAQAAYDRAAYDNAMRERAIQEEMLLRQTPINEISALTSGAQVQLPTFVNTPQANIQAPDFQGATYASFQGELANAQAQAQQQAALTQGLFSLGGAGLGAFGATGGFGFF